MKKTKIEIWTHFILRALSAIVCISFAVIGVVMNMPIKNYTTKPEIEFKLEVPRWND